MSEQAKVGALGGGLLAFLLLVQLLGPHDPYTKEERRLAHDFQSRLSGDSWRFFSSTSRLSTTLSMADSPVLPGSLDAVRAEQSSLAGNLEDARSVVDRTPGPDSPAVRELRAAYRAYYDTQIEIVRNDLDRLIAIIEIERQARSPVRQILGVRGPDTAPMREQLAEQIREKHKAARERLKSAEQRFADYYKIMLIG